MSMSQQQDFPDEGTFCLYHSRVSTAGQFRCASRFKHLINADETKLAELKKSEVRCDICQSVFRNLKVLNQHIRTIHEKRFPHHCDKCGAGLKTRAGLLQHRCSVRKGRPRKRKLEESDEEEEVDQCIFCGQDIASMDSYKDHMQYECPQNPQRRFKCSECSFESKSQKQFENHNCDEENTDRECEEDSDEAEEAETPANQCRKCGRVLRTVFALKHHSCRKESSLR
ncbi:hypothetical protein CAPTEDRAFT_190073 [Capitella teleta]|uniref:C2H2-type domain-containing protein n=1 Tax=Capitella teleta TaxID=283909 RepID=R7TP29_CAPTE|nr:hypothetical protein CAPTEDRAFT_190073 [Capitella teleta]|eukprot:ELT95292.1 hypothetical protein CAPTEDRAFT_190073 [Capitella teleta]